MVYRVLSGPKADEAETFNKFKEIVVDLKQEDWVLLRFLRARNMDLKKAEEMIRYAYRWREEIGIKNVSAWEFPSYYKNEMAYQFYGKDYDGAPACWVSVGKWNGKVLVDNGEGENLLRWAFAMIEQGRTAVKECNSQGDIIIDLDGLSYSQATHVASLKLFFQGCQKMEQCYPEIIKRVLIINAPWVFTMGWSFIKTIISKRTMEKIQIFGCNKKEWTSELLQMFPEENIIPSLRKDYNGN